MAGPDPDDTLPFSERVRIAAELLESLDADRAQLTQVSDEERRRLLHATRRVAEPDHHARRKLVKAGRRARKAARLQQDDEVLNSAGIRELRRKPVFTTPNAYREGSQVDAEPRGTSESQHCYVCKQHYDVVHFFYDQLCPSCAELNFAKRTELADLRGRVALLTGGRVKIGYQAGLKLLRAGARLIVTTRFPRDSAARYAREDDFAEWSDRLEIFGLDLRHTPSVEAFCREMLTTRDRLDFIINTACQTVRRPPAFYEHMMEAETASLHTLSEAERKLLGAFEGLRGYRMLPEASASIAPIEEVVGLTRGLTHSAQLSQ